MPVAIIIRFFLFLLFSGYTFISCAQPDQFTDFRSRRESFSRLSDKLIRSDIASFAIGGIEESLGKSPLRKLPVISYGNDFIIYDSNDTKIVIRAAPFKLAKHKFGYEGKYLTRIDNKAYYGNYGKVPATCIAQLTVIVSKDTISIPNAATADLYNPQFTFIDSRGILSTQSAVYISPDKRRIYIYMLNKDTYGSYEVTWIIQDKAYLRRILDFGFTP